MDSHSSGGKNKRSEPSTGDESVRGSSGDRIWENIERGGVFHNANDALLLLRNCVIVDCNEKTCELLQRPRDQVLGASLGTLSPEKQPDGLESGQLVRERVGSVLQGEPQVFEWVHVNTEGQPIYVELSLGCIHKSGKLVVGIMRDITRRRVLQEQLRHSHKMEAIGTLARGIAHDFNNVLGVISGYAELLFEDLSGNEDVCESLGQIIKATGRARKMVNQILTFSRGDKGEKSPIIIHQVVKETLKLIQISLPASIQVRRSIHVSENKVMADVGQIHQMVINLCNNAVQAMAEGGVLTIGVEEVDVPEGRFSLPESLVPGRYICIRVDDTGHGIEEEIRNRIFDPYFSTFPTCERSGMGLPVVLGIVQGHGGWVNVDSTTGEGTSVKVFLPMLDESGDRADEKNSELSGRGEHILFVDDEESLVSMAVKMLERMGYKVTPFTESPRALEKFMEDPGAFDLVITDQTMPVMNGIQLIQEIRDVRPDIPIILCTGFSEAIGRENYAFLGINEFIGKPILIKDMASAIRRVLEDR